MNAQREAMTKALDALTAPRDAEHQRKLTEAVATLRAALAEMSEPINYKRELGDLLARIHRDGGHYAAQFGIRQAIYDAHEKVAELLATHPHPARTLTDEELLKIAAEISSEFATYECSVIDFARAVLRKAGVE